MPIIHTAVQEDIYQLPVTIEESNGSITIGDLHGNAIKLLNFLIRYQVIGFRDAERAEQLYQEFVDIYTKMEELLQKKRSRFPGVFEIEDPDLEENRQQFVDNINAFNQLLSELEVSDQATLVRLIGDELADRGSCDYYTLKILEFLHQGGVNLKINLSNHSNSFLLDHERRQGTIAPVEEARGDQIASLIRLNFLTDNGLVDREEINQIIETVYKPNLLAIDYSITEEGIVLFTHAPVSYQLIKDVAQQLGVEPYRDNDKFELAFTIDLINQRIQKIINDNSLNQYLQSETAPLFKLAWNRWDETQEQDASTRPAKVNGFNVDYVHGHDKYQSNQAHIHNLDTESGKGNHFLMTQHKRQIDEFYETCGTCIDGVEKAAGCDEEVLKEEFDKLCEIYSQLLTVSRTYTKQRMEGETNQQAYDRLSNPLKQAKEEHLAACKALVINNENQICDAISNMYPRTEEVADETRFLNIQHRTLANFPHERRVCDFRRQRDPLWVMLESALDAYRQELFAEIQPRIHSYLDRNEGVWYRDNNVIEINRHRKNEGRPTPLDNKIAEHNLIASVQYQLSRVTDENQKFEILNQKYEDMGRILNRESSFGTKILNFIKRLFSLRTIETSNGRTFYLPEIFFRPLPTAKERANQAGMDITGSKKNEDAPEAGEQDDDLDANEDSSLQL